MVWLESIKSVKILCYTVCQEIHNLIAPTATLMQHSPLLILDGILMYDSILLKPPTSVLMASLFINN